MSDVNDKDLIEAILAGNQQAFVEFLQRYKNLVQHIVARMITNPVDREDLGQEIFLRVFDNLASFRFASKVSTWVAKIAHNTCMNYLTKKKIPLLESIEGDENKDVAIPDGYRSDERSPLDNLEQKDDAAMVHQAIDTLPVQYRCAITLFHLEEMSYVEICEVMNLPEGTVKSYLFRARKILQQKLLHVYAEEAA